MKRYHSLSVYRIIAALLILEFHVLYFLIPHEIPYGTLFSKCVQGLTALSGFLYASKTITDVKKFYLSNTKKLILPALFVLVLITLFDVFVMLTSQNFDIFSIFFGYRASNHELIYQFGNYYYIAYIFICYLITPLLQRKDKVSNIIIVIAVIIEVSLAYFLGPSMMVIPYIIGYYVGKFAFSSYVDRDTKYPVGRLFSWIGILAVVVSSYILLVNFSFGDNYFLANLSSLLKNITSMMSGVSSFFVFILIFRFINHNVEIKVLSFLDKTTYMIYLLNQVCMIGATSLTFLTDELWKQTIIIFLVTIALSVLFQFAYNFTLGRKKKKTS